MLYAVFGVLAIVLDQWTKYWAASNLVEGAEPIELISGLVSLQNVHNKGAAFSFLSDTEFAGKIFVVLALVFAVLVIVGIATNFISGKFARWCASLVAAGGIGNAIDRLLYGYVQDMIKFDFVDFPVFNVADIFITVFCALFILCIIFGGKVPKEDSDEDYYDDLDEGLADVPAGRGARGKRRYEDEDNYGEPQLSRQQASRSRRDADLDDELDDAPVSRNRRSQTSGEERSSRRERRDAYSDEFEQFKANRDARVSDSGRAEAPRNRSDEDPFAAWDRANASAGRSSRVSDDAPASTARQQAASYSQENSSRQASVRPVQQASVKPAAWSSDDLSDFFGQPTTRQNTQSRTQDTAKGSRPAASQPAASRPVKPTASDDYSSASRYASDNAPARQARSASTQAPVQNQRPASATVPAQKAPSSQPKKTASSDFDLDDILAEFK